MPITICLTLKRTGQKRKSQLRKQELSPRMSPELLLAQHEHEPLRK